MFRGLAKELKKVGKKLEQAAKTAVEAAEDSPLVDLCKVIGDANLPSVKAALAGKDEMAADIVSTKVATYDNNSPLKYALLKAIAEVDAVIGDAHKPINANTVPTSNHKVFSVIGTFVLVYQHCKTHASATLTEKFDVLFNQVITEKGLLAQSEPIKAFLMAAAEARESGGDMHFKISGYKVVREGDDLKFETQAGATASFDLRDNGDVLPYEEQVDALGLDAAGNLDGMG